MELFSIRIQRTFQLVSTIKEDIVEGKKVKTLIHDSCHRSIVQLNKKRK